MMGRVLILASNDATAERWADCVGGDSELQAVIAGNDACDAPEIDVVLTNRVAMDLGDLVSKAANAIVVAVEPAAGEVSVSAACPTNDLATICRLAAELAQLRRTNSASATAPLLDLSLVDELTGLPNRRAWQQELARQLLAAEQQTQHLCLAIVDLDHFKQINSGWGHPAGDRLLAASAHALRSRLRPGDFVARLGGDEFGLLFRGLPPESAAAVVERVRASVAVLAAREAPHVVGCSAGFACFNHGQPQSAEALFAAADRALAAAKQQGRDATVGWKEEA